MSDIKTFDDTIGRTYTLVNQFLGISQPAVFQFGKIVLPTFDLTKVTQTGEYQIYQSAYPAATGNTSVDFTPPPGFDDYYLNLSITLGVARTVDMLIVAGPNLIATTSSAALNILITQAAPVYIPDGRTLRITVNSQNAGDGNFVIGIAKVERPVGLGPLVV